MDLRTPDPNPGWLSDDELAQVRMRLPLLYVEAVPVRVDGLGQVVEVGNLLRATATGEITRMLVSGRVMYGETIRDALFRHLEKDLGPMAFPLLPASPVPFQVAEYFPMPGITSFTDDRQHAVSLAYVVPVTGTCDPRQDALEVTWMTPEEAACSSAARSPRWAAWAERFPVPETPPRASVIALVGSVLGIRRYRALQAQASAAIAASIPVNSAWWRERRRLPGDLVYLALGDSAGQGLGATVPDRGYVGRLAKRLGRRSQGTVRTVNLSVSGATTDLCVRDQLPRLARMTRTPDVVTLAIGANDIAAFDPERFERNLVAILDALPATTIVADLPCFFLPGPERRVRAANGIVRRLALERGLTVVPLHEATRRQGLRGTLRNSAGDLFHPNDAGYRVWASAFVPAVDARLRAVREARDAT
jgi:lysophospholipase L1-like esterase